MIVETETAFPGSDFLFADILGRRVEIRGRKRHRDERR